ncbi:SMI1/KNR4 family protein [Streptomyces sp. NPDC056944]|uniref:SMI1/KNR4 family protein n=1 Tax=unclassified Streptomyces TaxID=2593676 RepID=UPI0036258BEA
MSDADAVLPAWSRIVHWLREHAPAGARALNPPATDADLRLLADALGYPVPGELEAWLRVNNGSTALDTRTPIPGGHRLDPHPDSRLFPGGEVFLDCASIAERHGRNLRIAADIGDEDWWLPTWIPVLAEADAHYGLLLDTGGSREGAAPVLVYRETDYARRYAPSLGSVLTAVADVLEHGGGDSALTHGRYPSVREGHLVWD